MTTSLARAEVVAVVVAEAAAQGRDERRVAILISPSHRFVTHESHSHGHSNGHVAHSARQSHGHTLRMSKQSDWGVRVTHATYGWLTVLHTMTLFAHTNSVRRLIYPWLNECAAACLSSSPRRTASR